MSRPPRDAHPEARASTRFTFQGHAAAVQFSQTPDHHQSQPGTLVLPGERAVDLGEWLEQPYLILGADADAAVGHDDHPS